MTVGGCIYAQLPQREGRKAQVVRMVNQCMPILVSCQRSLRQREYLAPWLKLQSVQHRSPNLLRANTENVSIRRNGNLSDIIVNRSNSSRDSNSDRRLSVCRPVD